MAISSEKTRLLRFTRNDNSYRIILELSMPGMNGFDLMGKLAAQGISAKIIVIIAYDDAENRECALKLKAAAFLTKPVDDQALIDTIKWTAQTGKAGAISDAQK